MVQLLKLDQSRRKKPIEAVEAINDEKVVRMPPIVTPVSEAFLVTPRFNAYRLRHTEISEEAEHALAELEDRNSAEVRCPVRLRLARLNCADTAPTAIMNDILKRTKWRFATAPELIGFIDSTGIKPEYMDKEIVAPGSFLQDEFWHRAALVYHFDSALRRGSLGTIFAERVRREWLLLIVVSPR